MMTRKNISTNLKLQKGDVPATLSSTATLLRLSPSHQIYPRHHL